MFFQTIKTSGADIEVIRSGDDAPSVIVLPEVFGGIRGYVPLLEELANQGLSTAGINPRSCGGSVGTLAGLTLEVLAQDVADVVQAIAEPPIVVVGHAGGNRVARTLASVRPELVSGIVLIAAGGRIRGTDEAHAALDRAAEPDIAPDERIAAWNRMMFGVGHSAPAHLSEWGDRSIQIVAALRETTPGTPVELWWHGGTAPMLVLQGVNDEIAPVQNGQMLKEEWPDRVTLVDIPDAAHGLAFEQPSRVASEIARWIDSHSAATTKQ